MGPFLEYTVIGLTVGSFYALVALGYTIVYGIIRLINFAQGDLSMVGAFLGRTLLVTPRAGAGQVRLAVSPSQRPRAPLRSSDGLIPAEPTLPSLSPPPCNSL